MNADEQNEMIATLQRTMVETMQQTLSARFVHISVSIGFDSEDTLVQAVVATDGIGRAWQLEGTEWTQLPPHPEAP